MDCLVTVSLTLQPLPFRLHFPSSSHTCVRSNSYNKSLISIVFMVALPQCPCFLNYIFKSKNFINPTHLSHWSCILRIQPHPRVSDSVNLRESFTICIFENLHTWFCYEILLETMNLKSQERNLKVKPKRISQFNICPHGLEYLQSKKTKTNQNCIARLQTYIVTL